MAWIGLEPKLCPTEQDGTICGCSTYM